MLEEIGKRFEELIKEGQTWLNQRHKTSDYYTRNEAYGWLTASAHLVDIVTLGRGPYKNQVQAILDHRDMVVGVPLQCVEKMIGVLKALQIDWNKGIVRQIEYLISAENFDAF